jgi:hypothetical protein
LDDYQLDDQLDPENEVNVEYEDEQNYNDYEEQLPVTGHSDDHSDEKD